MGYYSNSAIDTGSCTYDPSYTSPEQQLLWRLDDLYDRLSEFPFTIRRNFDGIIFALDDYRYAPVKCFETYLDVQVAIKTAINDLKTKYGISIPKKDCTNELKPVSVMQLSIFDVNNKAFCRAA